MVEEKEIGQMLAKEVEVTLADGHDYKLSQLGILDLAYFEEKFGTINVLFNNDKPFTVIMHILYCLMKKHQPLLKIEDLNNLVTFAYINEHPEIIEMITKQMGGQVVKKETNPPLPAEKKL